MIRFYNGRLLSLSDGFEISDWEVWVEESMILYVGPAIGAAVLKNAQTVVNDYGTESFLPNKTIFLAPAV